MNYSENRLISLTMVSYSGPRARDNLGTVALKQLYFNGATPSKHNTEFLMLHFSVLDKALNSKRQNQYFGTRQLLINENDIWSLHTVRVHTA